MEVTLYILSPEIDNRISSEVKLLGGFTARFNTPSDHKELLTIVKDFRKPLDPVRIKRSKNRGGVGKGTSKNGQA